MRAVDGLAFRVKMLDSIWTLVYRFSPALQSFNAGAMTLIQFVVEDIMGHKRQACFILKKKEARMYCVVIFKFIHVCTFSMLYKRFVCYSGITLHHRQLNICYIFIHVHIEYLVSVFCRCMSCLSYINVCFPCLMYVVFIIH